MKITFLGTAAIGYPLSFCNCDNCQKAKLHRGKSLRKRASLLINDELIIDLGPEVQTAMMMYEKDMGKVIGKQGRIAKSIRALIKASASRENKKVIVEIVQ